MSVKSVQSAPPTAFRRGPSGDTQLIGVVSPSYGMERVSYMIPSNQHRYVTLKQVPVHRFERKGTFLAYTPFLVGAGVDLVHTFNQIPLNRPFVVTAELEMPRYLGNPAPWQRRFGLSRLASGRCRRILALSEATRSLLARQFSAAGFSELVAKLEVFRGAVHPGPGVRSATGEGPLKVLFVGGDGIRKGLDPLVEAAAALRKDGIEVELTVIGQPTGQSYVAPGLQVDPAQLAAFLAESPWITWHMSLPNIEVRRHMLEHDVFALPTFDESLGWVVAEAAMAGVPSIATNIFALPELVLDGQSGWLVALPLNEDRRWRPIGTAEAAALWPETHALVREGLIAAMVDAARDRGRTIAMGAAARAHIESLYSFDVADRHLDRIYSAAISRS